MEFAHNGIKIGSSGIHFLKFSSGRDFPGSTVVKTPQSPWGGGGTGSILALRSCVHRNHTTALGTLARNIPLFCFQIQVKCIPS